MTTSWRELARWLVRARPPRRALVAAVAAAVGASVTGLALVVGAPYLLLYSASNDRLVAGGTLAVLLTAIELLAFLRSPLRYAERLSSHELGLRSVSTWRRWLLATVGQWPYVRLNAAATGDLLDRALADTDALQDLWLRAVVPFVAVIVTMFGADVFVATLSARTLNPLAAAAGLAVAQALAVAVLVGHLPVLVDEERRVRRARSLRSAERLTLQQAAPELALLGHEQFLHQRVAQATEVVARRESRRDATIQRMLLVVWVMAGVALFATDQFADDGHPLSGRTGLVVLLLAVATAEGLFVVRQAVRVAAGVTAAAERLEALSVEPTDQSGAWPADHELRVSHLTWHYGHDEALADVSLLVPPGRRVALTGPNGSGKSTLLRLIARLDDAPGAVSIGATRLETIGDETLRQHLAYVAAAPTLLTGVVEYVIRAGRPLSGDVGSFLAEVGLVATNSSRWDYLSRGEAQRAALVRGLFGNHDIVLLDEPTSGLGPAERELVLHRLSRLDATVIIATHDDEVIAWCDDEYRLEHGRAVLVSR